MLDIITFSEYQQDYRKRLDLYMSEYVDNKKTDFLRKELNDYGLYLSALIKLSKAIPRYENGSKLIIREVEASLLKKTNLRAYHGLVVDLDDEMDLGQQSTKFINIDRALLENYLKSLSRILKFVNTEFSVPYIVSREILHSSNFSRIEDSVISETDDSPINNLYPHIFIDNNAFNLFKLMHEHCKGSKAKLADFSFIYRMMYKDKLIVSTPKMFIEWLSKEYDISLCKIKTLDKCSTDLKISVYAMNKKVVFNLR
ncbi:hypothetical protein [uncultured Flavobacterium sp.]|uniref:hypothetical protein n=1 Tax=uncultured Flavobacterium sp. TaxID=165435 RepID=UPI0025FE052E|nr:hypothetical protein [uncultured Flavobacterium sp.]